MRFPGLVLLASVLALLPVRQGAGQGPGGAGAPPPVEVARVQGREMISRITLVGTAEPWLETTVAAQEPGLVTEMRVDEGDRVGKGEILCRQEDTQVALSIETAAASLAEEEVLRRQAEREWERQQRLYAIKSVSEKAFEDARFNAEAIQSKVVRLKAEIKILEDRRSKMAIGAPVSGFVVRRQAQVGQWLGKGDPVVTLAVLDPIRVTIPVPERYVSTMDVGMSAEVTFDALPGEVFQGPITAIIPQADLAARTFPVRIRVANPMGKIKAGSVGRVTLGAGAPYPAVLVPKDALVLSGARAGVFTVSGGAVRFFPVQTGPAHGPLIEVKGDLQPGMTVVVRGNERLRPGQSVRIVRGDRPSGETGPDSEQQKSEPSSTPVPAHATDR